MGFGAVASDRLARHVADQVPGADRLDVAILLGTAGSSAGARASTMAVLAGGRRVTAAFGPEIALRTGGELAATA